MSRVVLVLLLAGVSSALVPSELVLDVRPAAAAGAGSARAFTAAVAEFAWAAGYPEQDLAAEPDAPWRRNMEIARRYAGTAAQQGADVFVLAEYAILKLLPREILALYAAEVPYVDELAVPCDDPTQHEVIASLSCLARTHRMYIVANYIEKEPCSSKSNQTCPEDGYYLFNTDLVFDRNGTLIQTYRKYNLFGPELENLDTPAPRLAAFRTDFGATIGLMTCFDILFEVPAVELVRRGITHFAFPTLWGDELPSLTALQMHSAWARGLNVTLLSSNGHRLITGSIGSGIFTGSGVLGYLCDYSSDGAEGGVVVATLPAPAPDGCGAAAVPVLTPASPPLIPAAGNTDAYYPIQHYNVSEFISVPLTGESVQLCDGAFCCELTFSEERPPKGDLWSGEGPTYRLLVLDGRRNFPPNWSTRICAVVLCADGSQESCSTFPQGALPPPLPAFTLRGSFGAGWTVFPSVLRAHMEMATEWRYDREAGALEVTDAERLMVAQLYARNYALDGTEYEERSEAGFTSTTSSGNRTSSCVPAPMS